MKRVLLIVGIILGVLLLAGAGFAIWAMGSPAYPTPTGPNGVGTLELLLTDEARTEGLGAEPGGPREVGIRIWYPAARNAEGTRLPIVDGRLAKAFSDTFGAPMGDADGPPSAAIVDAPPLAGAKRLPVVLFSHGGFSHRDQNLSTMEELASQGFIAIAIGHTHEAILSLLPDGRTVPMDPRLADNMNAFGESTSAVETEYLAAVATLRDTTDRESGVVAALEVGRMMTRMFEPLGRTPADLLAARHEDIALVRTQLTALDADAAHPLHGRYDLERVGVFGHSFGAHTALSACLDQTLPVQACVSLDTPYYLFSDAVPVPDLERPVLFAYAGSSQLPSGELSNMAGTNRYLRRTATVAPLAVVVDGMAHMNFSDMNFMPRLLRLAGVLGPIDSNRAATITDDLTVSFFRRHLLDQAEPWLDTPQERYSEVQPVSL